MAIATRTTHKGGAHVAADRVSSGSDETLRRTAARRAGTSTSGPTTGPVTRRPTIGPTEVGDDDDSGPDGRGDDAAADVEDGSATMSDEAGIRDTDGGEDRAGGVGPTDVPEESPSSESELALDRQAARIEAESEQDDE